MLSSVGKSITRRVEVFENERYSPLSGWSSKGLLLTDRKALSNHDGSDGYASLDEANVILLSRGWEWEDEGWRVDKTMTDVDSDGWSYRTDFTGFNTSPAAIATETVDNTSVTPSTIPTMGRSNSISGGGSAQKGFFHVVRRRKLIRIQYFSAHLMDPNHRTNSAQFSCDHCDLQEVQRLSYFMLMKLAEASVKKHPRHVNESKINTLKNELIEFLLNLRGKEIYGTYVASEFEAAQNYSLVDHCQEVLATAASLSESSMNQATNIQSTPVSAEDSLSKEVMTTTSSMGNDAITTTHMERQSISSVPTIMTYRSDLIDAILEKEFLNQQSNLLSFASSVLTATRPSQLIQERMLFFAQHPFYFITEEREEIARYFIRMYDVSNLFHCNQANCGSSCVFRVEQCEHNPCQVLYSHIHKGKHDVICPEKFISCDRVCGVELRRKELRAHLDHACILRPVQCPFYCIGCTVDLVARDLEHHVDSNNTSHMLLSLQRMKEYELVMSSTNQRVQLLEQTVTQQRADIVKLSTALAASTAALAASEKRLEKMIRDVKSSV